MGLDKHLTVIKRDCSSARSSVMDWKRLSEKDSQEKREALDLCVKEQLRCMASLMEQMAGWFRACSRSWKTCHGGMRK